MKIHKIMLFSVVVLSLALSACTPAKSGDTVKEPTAEMMAEPTEAMMDKPTEVMMSEPTDAMMDKPTEVMMAEATDVMMDNPTEVMMAEPTDAMLGSTTTPEEMMDATPTIDSMMAKPTGETMMAVPVWVSATLTDVTSGKTFTMNDFKDKVVIVELMAQWCPTCKTQQTEVKALHKKIGMPADLITIALDIDPNENSATLKTYTADNGFDWIHAISPADVSREIGNLYGAQFLNPTAAPILVIDRQGEVHPLPFGVKSADDLLKVIDPYLKGM